MSMMSLRRGVGILVIVLAPLLAGRCTGGSETTAAEEPTPKKESIETASPTTPSIDPRKRLDSINRAIPLYAGARYRDDLTRRDQVMIRNQYGPGAEVYTLATDDSFPQVYHYYTTYLAQFRAFPSTNPYPPEQKEWRTLEVHLNQAMQDPFIPGEALQSPRQVMLQVAETEAEPKTVIRYIITPTAPQVASANADTQAR
jgi:hypothetical protein